MLYPVTRPIDSFNGPVVVVAGVPWPPHKLFALIAGLVSLLLIGAVTTSAAPAVLGAAGVGVAVGLLVKVLTYRRD